MAVGSDQMFNAKPGYREVNVFVRTIIKFNEAFDLAIVLRIKLAKIVPDETLWRLYQQYIPGDAAVVPPVGIAGWYAIFEPLVVDLCDNKVTRGFKVAANFCFERCKAAGMPHHLDGIDPHDAVIVSGAKTKECSAAINFRIRQFPEVPECAFIPQERGFLCVPVPGYLHGGALFEAVFRRPVVIRRQVSKVAEWVFVSMQVVKSCFVGVDDVVPVPGK